MLARLGVRGDAFMVRPLVAHRHPLRADVDSCPDFLVAAGEIPLAARRVPVRGVTGTGARPPCPRPIG